MQLASPRIYALVVPVYPSASHAGDSLLLDNSVRANFSMFANQQGKAGISAWFYVILVLISETDLFMVPSHWMSFTRTCQPLFLLYSYSFLRALYMLLKLALSW